MPFVCFTCGQIGHKSPECSNDVIKKEPHDNKKDPKKSARTLKNNRVLFSEEDLEENISYSRVSALELSLLVDTGAQISVIPTELIPGAGETVKVRGYSGTADMREN